MNTFEPVSVTMAAERLGMTRRGVLAMIERDTFEHVVKSPGITGSYMLSAAEVEQVAKARAARKEARTA